MTDFEPFAIDLAGVTARYPGASSTALEEATLQVRSGARLALVGHNGAGKSTILKVIVDLVPLQAGTVRVHGKSFSQNRRRVAYLPQVGDLDWRFPVTVERLVLTGRYVHLGWLRRPSQRDRDLATSAMDRLGIGDMAKRQIGQLSGGQRQRALLARAVVQDADILLLDEPLNAVDAETRAAVIEIMNDLRAKGTTVLISTHDLDELDVLPEDVVTLADGRIVDTVHEHHPS